MTRQEKAIIIEQLTEKFSSNPNFYLTDASGLSVAQINAFRRMCFDKGLEYSVYKNTLVKKALEKLEVAYEENGLNEALKGYTGILFTSEDNANVPAKVITEYRKKRNQKKPLLKAASIDTDVFVGEEHLKMLTELKSKPELIGEVIALLQSPAKNVISALQSGKHTLAGLVKALEEREN
ncbi:50S ribosomal protein L10 [Fulvivirga sedimenti]|uniref:Large ribosomal subunit protein uL10 n=1 Tax=Fulvivirga sedimenti TaxID=2879465 RepID=A0A9X1L1C8_9BACT|nr:50S ribosomal protein L10 [Fulvivirga sedimenti]MCA6078092.1 50S ribosomal protein L10 [Fulvivirga sedimenti]